MNQTVTANIGGIVFHIEVDAFDNLTNYLNKIKSYFNNSEEREEIMRDIEGRIAEIFSSKLNETNQVIKDSDVAELIEVMGKPEQYIDEEEVAHEGKNSSSNTYRTGKKFFRDPDDRLVGGVAAGIANYFGIDAVWLRLLFVGALFIGFGFLLYIILWMVIPEAKTASDKLQMKGEAVNINNIGKTFKDEADKVSENLKNVDTGKYIKKAESGLNTFFNALGSFLEVIFNALGNVIGVAFLVVGLIFLISIVLWLTIGDAVFLSVSHNGVFGGVESIELFNLLFPSEDQYYFFITALLITLCIPIIVIVYAGIKLLFKIKTHFSVGLSLFIFWLFGVIGCLFLVVNVVKHQDSSNNYKEVEAFPCSFQEYRIQSSDQYMPGNEVLEAFDFDIYTDEDFIYSDDIYINVKKSKNEDISVQINYKSRGQSKKDAAENIQAINYNYVVKDSILDFSSYLRTPIERKIRGQKLYITIFLPIGKTIYLDESVRDIIYDIDNITNTHDSYMIGEKWIMLEDGLTCLDCDDIDGITSDNLEILKEVQE